LVERSSSIRLPRPPLSPRDNRSLRLACEYLADQPERNVGLDEPAAAGGPDDLAAAAGLKRSSHPRLFRQRIGLPPHALQIAHRIRNARRLLETGQTIAATAAATGFSDQSHLHRHFQRGLELTPGEYRRRFNGSRLTRKAGPAMSGRPASTGQACTAVS